MGASKKDPHKLIINVTTLSWIFLAHFVVVRGENAVLSRQKRLILWKEGVSRVQVIAGFGIPLDLKLETVIIGTVMKANYKLPTNISDIKSPGVVYSRKRRSLISRWDIYDMLAQASQMRGFGDGKSCVLRTICELSRSPLDKNNGLYDELARVLFDPKGTHEDVRDRTDNDYFSAHLLGKSGGGKSCQEYFPHCTANLIDMFTV